MLLTFILLTFINAKHKKGLLILVDCTSYFAQLKQLTLNSFLRFTVYNIVPCWYL